MTARRAASMSSEATAACEHPSLCASCCMPGTQRLGTDILALCLVSLSPMSMCAKSPCTASPLAPASPPVALQTKPYAPHCPVHALGPQVSTCMLLHVQAGLPERRVGVQPGQHGVVGARVQRRAAAASQEPRGGCGWQQAVHPRRLLRRAAPGRHLAAGHRQLEVAEAAGAGGV